MQTLDKHPITVTYKSGVHPTRGWDAMQVIYSQDGRIINHFLIARDDAGTIARKTDVVLDLWEVISDPVDLRDFQKCFNDRDRLAADQCQCGHSLAAHAKDVRGRNEARVDDALLPTKKHDIFLDKPVGESGCTQCLCRQYKPKGY